MIKGDTIVLIIIFLNNYLNKEMIFYSGEGNGNGKE
jgi:hypothetical protein